ncbi:hypothetical protein C8R45DRAFT_1044394 [Mycena sanguinolenta]|nr:hypothetical protein C8R45DRAFT_1044394 [Mycena sanguinolenta]
MHSFYSGMGFYFVSFRSSLCCSPCMLYLLCIFAYLLLHLDSIPRISHTCISIYLITLFIPFIYLHTSASASHAYLTQSRTSHTAYRALHAYVLHSHLTHIPDSHLHRYDTIRTPPRHERSATNDTIKKRLRPRPRLGSRTYMYVPYLTYISSTG